MESVVCVDIRAMKSESSKLSSRSCQGRGCLRVVDRQRSGLWEHDRQWLRHATLVRHEKCSSLATVLAWSTTVLCDWHCASGTSASRGVSGKACH
eukprot:6045940-Amphidinium_carterae.4